MPSYLSFWLSGLSLLVVVSMSAKIAFADDRQPPPAPTATKLPMPKPEFSPAAVVKIVVKALSTNDSDDTGVKTTWNFASPGNKEATGPIERFIPLVKSPAYQPLINSKSSDVRELANDGETAAELVIVTDADGGKAYFIFQMSKQAGGDQKDCWMTDGVTRVQPDDQKKRTNPTDGQAPA